MGDGVFAPERVGERLLLRLDTDAPERHGFVEPDATMKTEEYEAALLSPLPPTIAYAKLLIDMHRLVCEAKGDSEEAEALAERMDAPWYAMSGPEQERMRGLAADLNALREDGPKRVDMSPEQVAQWQRAAKEAYLSGEGGDIGTLLAFLRQPIPAKLPPQIVPFLQARCWEKLGDLETALVFMKGTDRLDRDQEQALSVLLLLQQLGRLNELQPYADRVIENPASPPLESYLAAVALLRTTQRMSDREAKPILQRVLEVLKSALSRYSALPPQEKVNDPPGADADIAQALGLTLERLRQRQAAIDVYADALGLHPRHAELLMARGLALYETDPPAALADFTKAVQLGVPAIWPYLLLARHSLQQQLPLQALRLALEAERQPGPPAGRAEVYETIAIAQAELGQSKERVLKNFDIAIALDPKNERIRENRSIAAAIDGQSRSARAKQPALRPSAIETEVLRRDYSDRLNNRAEWFTEERRSRMGKVLVGA
jgi:tetratricopeptide (TPR) repeat protein